MPCKPRTVHVQCADAAGYRWLKRSLKGGLGSGFAVEVPGEGFQVLDESGWAELLLAAGGKEVE